MLITVGFVSQKGGVGKSMLARALAAVTAQSKIRVKIADLDARQLTVARWEERREENEAGPALSVQTFTTASEALLAAGPKEQLLVIDAPAGANKGTLDIARQVDLLVQPSGPGIDDLDPAIILFHELVRAGVPRERLVMALCRVSTLSEEDAARAYVQTAGYAVLPGSVPELAAYREAHNRGQAVTEMKHKAPNARTNALMDGLLASLAEKARSRVQAGKGQRRKAGRSS